MVRSRSPSWVSLPGHRLLKGRAGHTATLVGQRLLVIGGRNGNEFLNDLWEFNIEASVWTLLQKHTPLSPRAYHTATLIQSNQIWVFGGSDRLTMFGDVHVLNTVSLEWTTARTEGQLAGNLRGTHAAIPHPLREKDILVFGGYGGVNSHWLSDLVVLHTDTLKWEDLNPKGAAPSGRGYHTFTAFGTHVLLFGGKGVNGIISSDAISVYDAEANMWIVPRYRGVIPVSRSNHAATLVKDDLILIHGGRSGSERLRDMSVLQILVPPVKGCVDSFAWRAVDQEQPKEQRKGRASKIQDPGGRSAHSLTADGSSMYLFGGYGGSGVTFDDIFVLQVAAIDGSSAVMTTRSGQKGLGQRPRTELGDTDGWRSTKQHRRHSYPASKTVEVAQLHILDSDDNTTEDIPDADLGPVSRAVEDIERRRSNAGVRSNGSEGVQEMGADRTGTALQERPHSKTAWEKDKHNMEVSNLQQNMVDSLKAEVTSLKASIDIKSLLESELRAGKAALLQNIQLLQNQVDEGHQKILAGNREMEKRKSEAHKHLAQANEMEKGRSEAEQKLTSSEGKVEGLSRSLETMKAACSKLTHDIDASKHEVQHLVTEVEKKTQEVHRIRQSHEQEIALLNKDSRERMDTEDRLLREVQATKDSSRTLHETVERLAKHVERSNAKIDALEQERLNLSSANEALAADQVRLVEARDGAGASLELVKGELRLAQSVIERNIGEISRMREGADQAKGHITSLHSSLKKNEEELKSALDDNEKLRLLVREVEDFENAQVRNIRDHVEKLRCVREFGPRG